MTRVTLAILGSIFAVSAAFAEATSPGIFVVNTATLNVRLAANTSGKVADRLFSGQKVEVFEVRDGWARVSPYYDGQSEGLAGNVARWVFATHLSTESSVGKMAATETAKPPEPPAFERIDADSPIYEAIAASDDLQKYQHLFAAVSQQLIDSGQCQLSDFRDIGGWWKSPAHQPRPVYYTYCGGATDNDRIYLDTANATTFR